MVYEIIGHLGGLLIAIALLPQLIKTWRTKSAKDISLLWTVVLLIGLGLYVIYAIPNKIYPIITFGTIEFLMTLALLVMKRKYG